MVKLKGEGKREEEGQAQGRSLESSPHSSPWSSSLPRLISGQPHRDRSSSEHAGPKRLRGASFPSTMGSLIYTAHEPKQPQQERGGTTSMQCIQLSYLVLVHRKNNVRCLCR